MNWQTILYALACVIAPVAWGLIVVWVSNRIERATRLRLPEKAAEKSEAPPIDYHI